MDKITPYVRNVRTVRYGTVACGAVSHAPIKLFPVFGVLGLRGNSVTKFYRCIDARGECRRIELISFNKEIEGSFCGATKPGGCLGQNESSRTRLPAFKLGIDVLAAGVDANPKKKNNFRAAKFCCKRRFSIFVNFCKHQKTHTKIYLHSCSYSH